MMMLSFNYTSLERGFESISLRCQYCKAEETRPWPSKEDDVARDQQEALVVVDEQPQNSSNEVAVDEPLPNRDEVAVTEPQSGAEEAPVDETRPAASSESTRSQAADDLLTDLDLAADDDYERMRLRFAGPSLPPAVPDT
jgi:hypothetical protein